MPTTETGVERRTPNPERRNRKVHEAVLKAAAALLEEKGYAGVTIEAIAARAGSSNKTLYRWWPNKAAIFTELYNTVAADTLAELDTGTLRGDLQKLLRGLGHLFANTVAGKAMRGMIAEAQAHPTAAESFRNEFMAVRRDVTRTILNRAIARNEIDPYFDMETLIDLTGGPFWYRLLLGHAPITDTFADQVVEAFVCGVTKASKQ